MIETNFGINWQSFAVLANLQSRDKFKSCSRSLMKHTPRIKHNCSHPRSYSQKYDAYYCESCDAWIEGKCSDPDCEFCKGRPEKPSECGEKK